MSLLKNSDSKNSKDDNDQTHHWQNNISGQRTQNHLYANRDFLVVPAHSGYPF